jgi:uncharacterized protein (DUF1330 family)
MPAYVIANVVTAEENEDMAEYRRRVQATLDPYGGRFVIRGGQVEVHEGDWHPLHLSIIEFPGGKQVRDWLESPEYQAILPLRTNSVKTELVVVYSGD